MQPLTLDEVWAALGPDIHREAAEDLWQHRVVRKPTDPGERRSTLLIVAALAAATGFREKAVPSLPAKQAVQLLLKHLDHPRVVDLTPLFVAEWIRSRHLSMLVTFLDAAEIPNNRGMLDGTEHIASVTQLQAGLRAVRATAHSKALGTYLSYCLSDMRHVMPQLSEALEAESLDPRVLLGLTTDSADAPAQSDIPAASPEVDAAPTKPQLSLDWMSSVDRLVIREIVATSLGEEGCRDADQLLELVDEFVKLNTDRIRSFYHLGFAHATLGIELRLKFTGHNEERRLWYLAGALAGMLRTGDSAVIRSALKSHSTLVTTLAKSDLACATELLPIIAPVLVDLSSFDLLRTWSLRQTPRLPKKPAGAFVYSLLMAGERFFRDDRSSEAETMFGAIMMLLDPSSGLPPELVSRVGLRTVRRLAQLNQRAKRFDIAQQLFESVVQGGSDSQAAKALGDLGIIQASCARLEDALPRQQEALNTGLAASLERGRTFFERAVARESGQAVKGHFGLGMLFLFGPASDPRRAAEHFGKAYASMLEHEDSYGHAGLIEHCAFLRGLALLETVDESAVGDASHCFDVALANRRPFPDYLWRRAVTAASLLSDHSVAERLCKHMLGAADDSVHDIIASSELHLRSPLIRRAYVTWLTTDAARLKDQWEQGLKILDASLRAREPDVAGIAMDCLVKVANADPARRHRLLERLADPDFYSPAWNEDDAIECRVQLMECDGNLGGAVELLREQFYRWRSVGTPLALQRARLLIEWMMELDAAADVGLLREQVRPAARRAGAVVRRAVHVLYVGGNETQSRYQDAIRAQFRRTIPTLTLTFLLPGWTSNWNDWLEKFKNHLPDADAVVLNSLVRTQFGRHVRRLCDEETPWFPCGGRGRQSIERSIEQAALFVLERDKP
jgi:hypothetical protein